MKSIENEKKLKFKGYKKLNSKLNEQAIQFEIAMRQYRPDLLAKAEGIAQEHRTAIREPHQIVTEILKDKGLMKEGESSVFDYFRKDKTSVEVATPHQQELN